MSVLAQRATRSRWVRKDLWTIGRLCRKQGSRGEWTRYCRTRRTSRRCTFSASTTTHSSTSCLVRAVHRLPLWVDCGTDSNCLMTDTTNDYIIAGPKNILAEWPSLKKAGFARLDAVLPSPANSNEAYFFSGEQYALINIKQGKFLIFVCDPSRTNISL